MLTQLQSVLQDAGVTVHLRKPPVFYSNAQLALESITQQKAAPQQWLAMLQKAGGIKEGEDR